MEANDRECFANGVLIGSTAFIAATDSFDSFHPWFRFFRCLREGMSFNAHEHGFPQIRFASAEGSEAEVDAEGSK